ncbi:cupin domain-containing protein [candidate division KSB1 bacterium]|nr:cupin domain-containing protein [candidate division KSB1 bacterium]
MKENVFYTKSAEYWIENLALISHPEGGYFRETFAASEKINTENLPGKYSGPRKIYTLIFYLLKSHQVSHFHRLKSDEIWNFYMGSPLTIHIIEPNGNYIQKKLGPDIEKKESFQLLVQAGCWFGATVDEEASYTLVGCFVAPGFDYEDFELAKREELIVKYPAHRSIIERLTWI